LSVSMYESRVGRLRSDLERHRSKQSAEEGKAAKADDAAENAARAAAKSSSPSTARSKQGEARRHRGKAIAARAAASKASTAAAKVEKDLHAAEAGLEKAREQEAKRQGEKHQRTQRQEQSTREREERRRRQDEQRRHQEIVQLRQRVSQQELRLRAAVPEHVTVLVIAASPDGEVALRLDREVREIQRRMRESEYRDSIRFEWRPAARLSDVVQMLNEVRPDVVHLSAHGNHEGVVLENADGTAKTLRNDQLAQLLATMSDNIRLIIFNSCLSSEQAEVACNFVEAAVGMESSILDEAAKVFAGQFYNSLGFGKSLHDSFEQARLHTNLEVGEDSGSPRLYTADGLDPRDLFLVAAPGAASTKASRMVA
jgi:hypothetical protein